MAVQFGPGTLKMSKSKEVPELIFQESVLKAEGSLVFGEVRLGNEGKRIVNISSEEGSSKRLSFCVLKPEECLIKTSFDGEVFGYVSQRIGKPIVYDESVDFFAVAGEHSLRIIDPTADRMRLLPTPNKKIESSPAVKSVLAPIADREIVLGQSVKVAENENGDIYVLPIGDDLLSASRDLGVDTKSAMTVLKKDKGELMFVSHGWGKPLTVAPEIGSWAKVDLSQGNLAKTLRQMGELIFAVSDPREKEQVGRHLLGKLASKADIISGGKEFYKSDNSGGNVVIETPSSLRAYLKEWRNGILASRKGAYKGKFESVPLSLSPSVLFSLADIGIDEETMERRFLPISPDRRKAEWPEILAEIEVSKYLEPKETERILRLAGIHALGESAGAVYLGICEECKVRSAAGDWKTLAAAEFAKQISKVGADHLSSLTSGQVKALVVSDSRSLYLNPIEVYETVDREFVEPRPGYQWGDIVHREAVELRKLSSFGKQGLPIYETPWTRQLSEKLASRGFGEAAQITWALAEGHVELGETTELEALAEILAQSAKFIRDAFVGPVHLQKEWQLEDVSPQTLRLISEFCRMTKATFDWKHPEGISQPTGDNPGLRYPLMLIRPDLAREGTVGGDRGFETWKMTEAENSPGGLGELIIEVAGYPEVKTNLLLAFHNFMENIGLPSGINADSFDRNSLTVVMTEDWKPYQRELEVFLAALAREYGTKTAIHSIEELGRLGEENLPIGPGFVWNFAYPWNLSGEGRTTGVSAATKKLTSQQGKSVVIFNDGFPALYRKSFLAPIHFPHFKPLVTEALATSGEDKSHVVERVEILKRMAAKTTPVVERTDSSVLNKLSKRAIDQALVDKDAFVLKVDLDPQGQVDWGGRGLCAGVDVSQSKWEEEIQAALAGPLPYVLQEMIDNAPFDQPRTNSQAGIINGEGNQQIGIFVGNPDSPSIGKCRTTSVRARWNPFLISYPDKNTGKLSSHVIDGLMTFTPSGKKDKFTKVHLSTHSADVPVKRIKRGN